MESRPQNPVCLQRAARRGFTMVEMLLAMLVLLVAVGGTLGTLHTYVRLNRHSDERTQAIRAAERQLERLQSEPFVTIFRRYNDEVADDFGGALPFPGAHFAVPGLDLQPADADGFAGRIRFPVDPGVPGALREDLVDDALGTPYDLDLDGNFDSADHADDHFLLPVRVEVAWRGPAGLQTIAVDSILAPR